MEDILNKGINNQVPGNNTLPPSSPSDVTANIPVQTGTDYVIKEPPPHGLDSSWRRWKCLVCGHVYEGISSGKMICPRCGNADPDKFDEAE